LKRGCLSPETLELKEGAAVMFTKNSPQGRFVNGTLGTVEGFDAGGMPIVHTKEGRIVAEPMEWQVEENGKVRASVSQVPLRLAYAMTIHKSQGMSMDAAVMDLSQAFEYGQGYVALSRVKTLNGLHLLGINQRALEVHPQILEKDRDLREASRAAAHAFAEMPREDLEKLQRQFVKAQGGAWFEPGSSKSEARNSKQNRSTKTESGMPGRLAETLSIVRDAHSLRDAAKERGLAVSTIVSHLEELQELGKLRKDDYTHLIDDPDALGEMQEAWKLVGGDKLTPIFKALHGKYSFEALRIARLTLHK
jgi:DNA-binding NarL/FixJ family response regulator